MEYKKCPKCSADVKSENKYCCQCGYELEGITNSIVESKCVENIKNIEKLILNRLNIKHIILQKKKIAVIISSIIIIVLVSSGIAYNNYITKKNYANYVNKFAQTETTIDQDVSLIGLVCLQYTDSWNLAIINGSDINAAIQAIQNDETNNGTFKLLDDNKKQIDNNMKNLSSPPNNYKNAYSDLVKLYGTYSQMYSEAEYPSGSLIIFNNSINDLQSNYTETYNELNAEIPSK